MEIGSAEDVVSAEVDETVFKSCAAVGESLGSNANYWCWEMEEDDYTQVFKIAGLFLLISLGYYLLAYGAFLWASTSLKAVKCPTGNVSEDENGIHLPMNGIPEFNWYNDGVLSTVALSMYLFMFILISIIYFGIKVYIVAIESPHYIWTLDDHFNNKDFDYFVNARVIVMIGIFLVNSTFFWCTNLWLLCSTLFFMMDSDINILPISLLICWIIISIIDAIFSFIIFCIYYPMIVTFLYFFAVGLIVYITIMLICCCISPCISCVCVRMCVDMLGLMRIRYDRNNNAEIQCMTPCARFVYSFMFIIVIITFVYLSQCMALSYIFGFLDGPSKSIFYVDFNSTNDNVIFYLFMATLIIGFIGLIMGLSVSCCRNREIENENIQSDNSMIMENEADDNNNDNDRNRNENGIRRRRRNNDNNNNNNNQRSDPFNNPDLGHKLYNNDVVVDDYEDERNYVAL